MRYSSAMATIQIRDLPEGTYEILRKRARQQGQSLQTYMREKLITEAASPKPEDIWSTVEQLREQNTGTGATTASIVADVRALRGE